MIEYTIEQFFEIENERIERILNEGTRLTELVQVKVDMVTNKELEEVVEKLEENVYFSIREKAKKCGLSKYKLGVYLEKWCDANNKQLISNRGGGKSSGTMIISKET